MSENSHKSDKIGSGQIIIPEVECSQRTLYRKYKEFFSDIECQLCGKIKPFTKFYPFIKDKFSFDPNPFMVGVAHNCFKDELKSQLDKCVLVCRDCYTSVVSHYSEFVKLSKIIEDNKINNVFESIRKNRMQLNHCKTCKYNTGFENSNCSCESDEPEEDKEKSVASDNDNDNNSDYPPDFDIPYEM